MHHTISIDQAPPNLQHAAWEGLGTRLQTCYSSCHGQSFALSTLKIIMIPSEARFLLGVPVELIRLPRILLKFCSALSEIRQLRCFLYILLDQIPIYWLPLRGYSTAGFSKPNLSMCKPICVRIKTRIASSSLLPLSHSVR